MESICEPICRDCKFYERNGFYRGSGTCHNTNSIRKEEPVFGRWDKELSGCENFTQGRFYKRKQSDSSHTLKSGVSSEAIL